MKPIRVLVVDDSLLFLEMMQTIINADPALQVIGTAQDGQKALELVPVLKPQVIVCDVQMPRMSGIEFLKNLLPKYPLPVVVISSTPSTTLQALQNGAVDFIRKPGEGYSKESFFRRLIPTIKIAAGANMGANVQKKTAVPPQKITIGPLLRTPKDSVIAIGASTGGTEAIAAVVKELPANSPAIVVTQHMPAGFTSMYASRLAKECKMRVTEAVDGQRIGPGQLILAAGEHQLRLHKDVLGYYVSSIKGPKVSGHAPSVDVLFESVSQAAGDRAVGVILTGMGGDGAEGLLKMRKAGAFTIGQDEQSCVVYGMPMVAFKKGAVVKQLPLTQIPQEIIRYLNGMK